jgi:fimbrial chaperone protein
MTERYLWKAAIYAAFLFIFGIYASTAIASISVSPVRLDLSDDHDKGVVRISNQEETSKSYQVEVVAWSQTDERREVYAPTDALLAVPPLFSLEPGEEQLVRIGMIEGADPTTEKSYRVFITEIAPPQPDQQATSGVSMRLQIGIPVFVAPTTVPFSTFELIGSKQIGNQLFLQFHNTGNVHVKVSEVHYRASDGAEPVVSPAAMYLLAGQKGYVPVYLPDGMALGNVTIVTDSLGTLEYELPVAP